MKRSPGKWHIKKAKDGTYYNRLVSRNGLILCENTGFENIDNAQKNIDAICEIAKISPIEVDGSVVTAKKRKTPYMR